MGGVAVRLALVCATAFGLTLGACGLPGRSVRSGKSFQEPLPPPVVTAGELDGRALIADLAVRAGRLGAGVPSLVVSAEAVENGWVGGFVQVPLDQCVLSYARGSPSIDDVDVAIYSEEGTSLAVDEGRDVHPTVLLCSPHPGRVYVAAHVIEGEGLVAVGAQLVPRERALIVARALGARGGEAEGARPVGAWPGLDEAVRVHRLELGGNWEEFKRVALPVDARAPTTVSLPVAQDQCVDAMIIPGDAVALLDVEVADGEGRVVARSREGRGSPTLTVCSPLEMAGALSIRPHVGIGLAAVVLARAPGDIARDLSTRPDVAWVAPSQPLDVTNRAHEALLAKHGYDAPVATASGSLVFGHRFSLPLDLKPLGAACARIDVVAGAPLALVSAHVVDDRGVVLASGEASSSVTVFACARGSVRLELEPRGRPGPFKVTVRAERWKDPVFAARPLAGSRMLSRAASGPEMLFDGNEAVVRELSLAADRVVSWTETVPAGRCLQATVGVEGNGAGVEIRAFEGADSEVDRAEAAYAASVRPCAAADSARSVRLEARASAGHMDAVLGERVIGKDPPSR
jgi:hypothetical protein